MAKNILVINVDIRETRVALIENGIIAELHLERESNRGTLGNIYLGKVSRVLPGMQAAFMNIGQERAAFLHVEDLIRPDDLDAYLSGHRHKGSGDEERESSGDNESAAEASDSAEAEEEEVSALEAEGDEDAEQDVAEDLPEEEEAEATEGAESAADDDSEDAPLIESDGEGEDDDAEIGHGSFADASPEAQSDDEPEDADDEVLAEDDEDEAEPEPEDEDEEDDDDDELAASGDEDDDAAGPDDDGIPASERRSRPSGPALIETKVAAQTPEPPAAAAESLVEEDETEGEPAEEGEEEEEELSASEFEDMDLPRVSITDAPGGASGAEGAAASRPEDEAGLQAPRARTRRGGRGRRRRGKTRPEGAEDTTKVEAEAPREARPAPVAPPAEKPRGGRGEGGRGEGGRGEGGRNERSGSGRDRQGRGGREAQGRSRDGDKRGRRDGRRTEGRRGASAPAERRQGRAKDPLRVSKSTPIRDVVREGQEVIVQVSKEPIGTKGARVTSHISLPGRYAVYLPTVEHIGISKRIGSDKERARLREAIEAMKPPQGGLIVRTLAEGLTKKSLKADVGYLVRLWGEIVSRRETTERAPNLLYSELDLVLKTARDLFTDDIEKIVIDSREAYTRLRRFVEIFMPDRVNAIELYEGEEPIFDAYGIEDEIGRALSRKVPLSSGGHLIIDQAEALTAIDVNTGRFVGRGSRDLEDTILQTNLEAVEEIAYQLRFRNIGGLIILDLINMERISNREKVRRRLEQLLAKDKAKTTLNRISDLGLIEMTRKRTRESLGRIMNEPCFYCDGTGNLQSRQTIAYEILRQIKRERTSLRGYSVVVNAHPAVVDFLRNEERAAVIEAERRYMRRVELVPRKEYHLEQFDLAGK